ncbi:MAG: hypothetical protein NWT08_09980 [Akkermansiaceae bacterium]|jgi:hypothetical protein|nr:hypothetical protein [Akkermansiaceae bacterium]MDP4721213.1 hypothetical protein [Akkermansiaceae bacterium]MDP4778861.1 hypothetical protein [Akkermansiaceae bacterium]MDP4846938.1 hypothetical protein [Akkermansiaceae bacterium]MDP4897924.1 hypothetical protein [Akkermansiaceae bacterium]
MTKPEILKEDDPWYSCTAEGSEMSNLLIGSRLTFREKLQWLEEAESLSLIFQKHREQQQQQQQ